MVISAAFVQMWALDRGHGRRRQLGQKGPSGADSVVFCVCKVIKTENVLVLSLLVGTEFGEGDAMKQKSVKESLF